MPSSVQVCLCPQAGLLEEDMWEHPEDRGSLTDKFRKHKPSHSPGRQSSCPWSRPGRSPGRPFLLSGGAFLPRRRASMSVRCYLSKTIIILSFASGCTSGGMLVTAYKKFSARLSLLNQMVSSHRREYGT